MVPFTFLSRISPSAIFCLALQFSLAVSAPQQEAQITSSTVSSPSSSIAATEAAPTSKTISPTNISQAHQSDGHHHNNTTLIVAIIVPIVVVLIVGTSLIIWCRHRRARRAKRRSKARQKARDYDFNDVGPTRPVSTKEDCGPFYKLDPSSFGAGYSPIAQLSPVYTDQESPRSNPFHDTWRYGHSRNVSLDSDASGSAFSMAGALPSSSSRSDEKQSPYIGKRASMGSSPTPDSQRSKRPISTTNISCPYNEFNNNPNVAPVPWTADMISSDGSDRATPRPLPPKAKQRATLPAQMHNQEMTSVSTYDPTDTSPQRMSVPLMLAATPPAWKTTFGSIGETMETDVPRSHNELSAMPEEPESSESGQPRANPMTRTQTVSSVSATTIRSSVDTIRAAEMHRQMSQMELGQNTPAAGSRQGIGWVLKSAQARHGTVRDV